MARTVPPPEFSRVRRGFALGLLVPAAAKATTVPIGTGGSADCNTPRAGHVGPVKLVPIIT
jgi:hypothetical protein